ncbi:MAG TPA: putative Na+/H+ antiporter [Candidatus Polarisedimenticolia bacterium]|nr:putative Na+/H+ antiporter [Candidatus Polarisedimenticolia bacterium]
MIDSRAAAPWRVAALVLVVLLLGTPAAFAAAPRAHGAGEASFPPSLDSYQDAHMEGLWQVLRHRVAAEPFNLWATVIFFCAIIHTFMAHWFRHIAHVLQDRHRERHGKKAISPASRLFHFLGEIEAVFGIWALPLVAVFQLYHGRDTAVAYINRTVNFTEPVFVVVIMTIASTRPILQLAERMLRLLARLGRETPTAWWIVLLTAGPILGSFITEPAAMTICALLLSRKFYALNPGPRLGYATLGLLFVAVSVGGTLTHFAAPPVLMVADAWGWNSAYMITRFGWKAVVGILLAVGVYYLLFRRQLGSLAAAPPGATAVDEETEQAIPLWVTVGHLLFMGHAVLNAHNLATLMLGMLFFLAFVEVTEEYQRDFTVRPPMLVGFFLAGLVIHGGLQQWWIAPILGGLGEFTLMFSAMTLTAFNDNAAITYLCTLVPTFTEGMKYAAVAGAVAGGGLTVIANAPNPAGQSILGRHFDEGISALGLLLGALLPTAILMLCFLLLNGSP